MQKQEIKETLPLWALDVATRAGIRLREATFGKLTPKTLVITYEGGTQTLYQRNAWK